MSVTVGSRSLQAVATPAASQVAGPPVRLPSSEVSHATATGTATAVAPTETRLPITDSPELAQCEVRLSVWVHGPAGKTPDGEARIAQLTEQVDTIRASIRKSNEAAAPAGRGSLLNVRA